MHRSNLRAAAKPLDFDFDELLHPAQAFAHPSDLVSDPDLTRNEKRAILSSWASDACAVDSAPHLRRPPGAAAVVTFDDILDALRSLDHDPDPPRPGGAAMRRRGRLPTRYGGRNSNDAPLT